MELDIFEEVRTARTIGISGHQKPDGDCIGACLGLALYLQKRMPKATVEVFLQKPGVAFDTIPAIDRIITDFPKRDVFDVFIALDTTPDRMGEANTYFEQARNTINIDHHYSNLIGGGQVNYIDATASATSELIYEVIDHSYLDAEIATNLYMGIAHDTGVFRYSNTAVKTMQTVAELMKFGFDFPKLLDDTFYGKTYVQNLIQGRIVLESRRYLDGQLIIGSAERKLMKEYGATKDDFDGVVNQLRITQGVECAIFIYEKEAGVYKVSLRASSDAVNVAVIAEQFLGGGHIRAAGCEFNSNLRETEERFVALVQQQLMK